MKNLFVGGLLLLSSMTAVRMAEAVSLTDIETAIIQKNFLEAEQLARSFISQNPSKAESDQAQYYLGLSLLWLGKHRQAHDIFSQLLSYQPEIKLRDKVPLGIIDVHYMDGKYQEAILLAKELLKTSPRSESESLIYLKLARANLKLARWGEAQKYLKKIVKEFSQSPEAHIAKQLLEEKQYFAVQVGAFLDRAKAEQLVVELKQRGEYVYIVETTDSAGRQFYRVRVGQLAILDEANKLSQKLSSLGYPTQVYP